MLFSYFVFILETIIMHFILKWLWTTKRCGVGIAISISTAPERQSVHVFQEVIEIMICLFLLNKYYMSH